MEIEELKNRKPEEEFIYSASRSGGPGGQNVNKVSTKVELRFNIAFSVKFSEAEKTLIFTRLHKRINKDGELRLVSQSERSQLLNKEKVTQDFYKLIARALTLPRKRHKTRPTLASKEERIKAKKLRGDIKKQRKDPGIS